MAYRRPHRSRDSALLKVLKDDWPAVLASYEELARHEVEVGLLNRPQATKGFYLEFGTRKMPARAWMQRAAWHYFPAWQELIRLGMVWKGSLNPTRLLNKIKARVVKDIRKSILEQTSPDNSPATILRKRGVGKLLVETGAMLASIRGKVHLAGTVKGDTW